MGVTTIWDYIARAFHVMFDLFYIDGVGNVTLGGFLFCLGLVHLLINWFIPFFGRHNQADRVYNRRGG